MQSLDKTKSMLMGVAFEKKKKLPAAELDNVEHQWTEMYRILGKKRVLDADVLTIAANLSDYDPPGKGHQESTALTFFREEVRNNRLTPLDPSKFLREVVSVLDQFLEDPRHRAVCRVKQARLLAAALLLSPRLKNDSKSRQKTINAWENAMYRLYVLAGEDSRTGVGDCIRLAAEIRNGTPSVKRIMEQLATIANVTPEQAVLGQVKAYQDWTSEEIIYFFWKYEERLSADKGEDIDKFTWGKIWEKVSKERSVEHIYPQHDPDGNWKGKARQSVTPDSFVHRIANLLVLPPGLNSKAGTKSFDEKRAIYKKGASGLNHVAEVAKLKVWNLAALEKREKRLLKFAKEQWWY